jgi:hypothetical protein
VQIILQCPPCPDSIISSNMNWGTYIKVNLKILCKHWLQGGICHLQSTNNTQSWSKKNAIDDTKFWYDVSKNHNLQLKCYLSCFSRACFPTNNKNIIFL